MIVGHKLAAKNCPRTLLGWDNFCHDRPFTFQCGIARAIFHGRKWAARLARLAVLMTEVVKDLREYRISK